MINDEQYKITRRLGLPPLPSASYNFSIYVNKYDANILIDSEEDYNKLVDYDKNRDYSRYKALVKKYYIAQ